MNDIITINAEIIERDQYAELLNRFIVQLDAAKRTKECYQKNLTYFFKWMDDNRITEPHRADILAYKEELMRLHATTTAAAYLTPVREFFAWLNAETGYPNIAIEIKNPKNKRTSHLRDSLSVEQSRGVLDILKAGTEAQKRDKALISLLLFTGLRTIEAVRADVCDIRSLDGYIVLYVQGKGREAKDDFVKLSKPVQDAINDYLQARGKTSPQSPLFCSVSRSNYGERLTTRSVSRIAKNALKAAGIDSPTITAHSFRHTAVYLCMEGGASIRDAQKMARHASPLTTEKYTHDRHKLKDAAEDALAAVLLAG